MALFHTSIFEPLYNFLIGLYNILPGQDFGVVIIVATVIIKFALAPIFRKQIESQKKLQELQPQIKELQKKHKDDKEKQTRAVMAFYKENNVNPFAGCLPLILQLIIFLAIYHVIISLVRSDFSVIGENLYSFVANPGTLNQTSLGVIDLMTPNYVIAVLAAAAMYYQSKMLLRKKSAAKKQEKEKDSKEPPDFATVMTKQMLYIGPAITLVIGFQFAAGLTLYWLASILFTIAQQFWIQRGEKKQAA